MHELGRLLSSNVVDHGLSQYIGRVIPLCPALLDMVGSVHRDTISDGAVRHLVLGPGIAGPDNPVGAAVECRDQKLAGVDLDFRSPAARPPTNAGGEAGPKPTR
jgi:hypothetical protein